MLVLFMIAVGAMVTTIRAGDTNPGWSLRFWEWIATWWSSEGGRAYEDGHRVIGTVVGFVGIALAIAVWKGETGARRWVGVLALGLIALQGVLGGLRVLVVSDAEVRDTVLSMTGGGYDVELRRAVKAMIHGVTAQVIFASLACIAVVTSPRWLAVWGVQRTPVAVGTRRLSLVAVALVTVQLALGTIVRQTGEHVLLHVAGACTVTLVMLWLLLRVFRHHSQFSPLRRVGGWIGVLLVTQVFLGITPWMLTGGEMVSTEPGSPVALMRTAHVTVGALILALTAILALWVRRVAKPEGDERPVYTLSRRLKDYYLLTKARLSALVMVTVAAGYLLAVKGEPHWVGMGISMFGVALVAGGVAALNQYMERDRDALMNRTRNRPLPSGRMSPTEAMAFGLVAVGGGTALLLLFVNALAAVITLVTAGIYLFIYTPLKTRTTLNTLVGAVPGALPPVAGWAAATGEVGLHAFVLFAILYVWQLPHFWSIARIYRDDYEQGGMKMLSVVDRDGGFLAHQIAVWCIALTAVSMLPVLVGMAGMVYAGGAIVLGLGFLAAGAINASRRTRKTTRGVFFASLIYLPLLLAVLIVDVTALS
jgi:protoheme IX farnesyltransferase